MAARLFAITAVLIPIRIDKSFNMSHRKEDSEYLFPPIFSFMTSLCDAAFYTNQLVRFMTNHGTPRPDRVNRKITGRIQAIVIERNRDAFALRQREMHNKARFPFHVRQKPVSSAPLFLL